MNEASLIEVNRIKEESKRLKWSSRGLNHWRLRATLECSGPRVLDVGCASGAYVQYLCENGYEAFGLDLLSNSAWADRQAGRFVIADVGCLPFDDNGVDTVLAFEILEHLIQPQIALQEIHRVCTKNVIVSVPNGDQPEVFSRSGLAYSHWIDRTHRQAFSVDSLVDALTDGGFSPQSVRFINLICPDVLFLHTLGLDGPIGRVIIKLLRRMPFRKKYYLTILAIAEKRYP